MSRMRQISNAVDSFVEKQIKLFENEDSVKKAAKNNVDQPYNLHSLSSSPHPPFSRSVSLSSAVDMSAYNNVTMDVLDIKTMLLRVKRVLEQVRN